MGYIFNRQTTISFRRELRKNLTMPERMLWHALRNDSIGVKFRRQHNIGSYVADFYCAEKKLIVEIDGDSHYVDDAARSHDAARDRYFAQLGLRVIRVTNHDVMTNRDGVLEHIRAAVAR